VFQKLIEACLHFPVTCAPIYPGVRFDLFAPSLVPHGSGRLHHLGRTASDGSAPQATSLTHTAPAHAGRAPMQPAAAPVASFSLSGVRRGPGATFRIARGPGTGSSPVRSAGVPGAGVLVEPGAVVTTSGDGSTVAAGAPSGVMMQPSLAD
jgi:hypothetical protein